MEEIQDGFLGIRKETKTLNKRNIKTATMNRPSEEEELREAELQRQYLEMYVRGRRMERSRTVEEVCIGGDGVWWSKEGRNTLGE